ncbi:MAG: tyrosine-type recombinase/integrase [Bacteroidales bacterium]|nr:tyrosine-type recombinase/integrase [Bacteroidales bacterium]MCF8328358.1 tyrosine-type recombinase/integrase [Bacteroidales bacterium]
MNKGFFEYIEYQKRYSPHTLTSYKNDLGQFGEFLAETYEENPEDATFPMIRSWVVDLIEKSYATTSIHRKISCIKAFYNYLRKQNHREDNPARNIQLPKKPKQLPVFLTETQSHNLLDEITFAEDMEGLRDKAILELFYSTGIRLNELINLKDYDVNYSAQIIKVTGKGKKQRVIPISDRLLRIIKNFQEKKAAVLENTSSHLFVTNKGYQTYSKLIYRIVNKYLKQVSTAEKKSPHVLRHTFATHMLNNGADINAVKELLGHASLSATQVYTHNTVERIKSIYKQAHPRA